MAAALRTKHRGPGLGPTTQDPFTCGSMVGGSCFLPTAASARGERLASGLHCRSSVLEARARPGALRCWPQ